MNNVITLPGEPPAEGRWETVNQSDHSCYYFMVNVERRACVDCGKVFLKQFTGVLVSPVYIYVYPRDFKNYWIKFLFTPNDKWQDGLDAFSSMTTPAELFPYLWFVRDLESQQEKMLFAWHIHNSLFGSQPVGEFVITKELKQKHLAQMKASLWHPIWQEWIDAEEKMLKGM